MKRWVQFIAGILCAAAHATGGERANVREESFETPETTWRLVDSDCRPLRVALHQRRFEGAHSGRGCEQIQIVAGQGTYAYLTHDLQPARIIAELVPSIWIKSDRHGLQLMARVVFPRSLKDGKPITSLLYGDRYESSGNWRQLRIDDVLTKLNREVVALRTQNGPQLDEREAYIDMLVLNAYTGLGPTSIWIDDLELSGFAAAQSATGDRDHWPAATVESSTDPTAELEDAPPVALQGNILVADERPIFVRAIEHQGETFAFLQSLGFNAVKIAATPTTNQSNEAKRCGIWLIAPPPIANVVASLRDADPSGASGLASRIDTATSMRIIAWHLGERLTARDMAGALARIEELQQREGANCRPFVANIAQGWSQARHDSLISVLEHPVLTTSFELQDYPTWLEYAARQNRSSAPFWATVPTEPNRELLEQVVRLKGTSQLTLEPDQMRWLAFAAVGSGTRGLWFRSRTRLDGQDAVSRLRSATVRQLNRELELIAPWAAGGTAIGEQSNNNSKVRVFGLQTEKARLLILLRRASDQQFVSAAADSQPTTITLHHPPATDQTYFISPSGIESVPTQRGGGMRLTIGSPDVLSLVLLTSDAQAVNYVGRTSAAIRQEVALARGEIVSQLLETTDTIEKSLQQRGVADLRNSQRLTEARSEMRRASNLQESNDFGNVLRACDAAANAIRHVRRGRWEQVVQSFTSPSASPLCMSYASLPDHFVLRDRLASATWGVDSLAAGEMEYLDHLLQSGWKQHRGDLANVSSDVRLSLDGPHGGRSCLHLRAWSSDQHAALDGELPVTISSGPIAVQAGQLLRVQGWAKVPQKLDGSWDGLMIYDSHSGPNMAERIAETQGWREFTMYRTAVSTGEWRLTFALTGLGEAWIDDVSVVPLANESTHQAALK